MMNVWPVEVTETDATTKSGISLSVPHLPDTVSASELGIRPEHLDVAEPDACDLNAVADKVEHPDSDTNIYVNVDGLGPLTVRKHGSIPARPGDRLELRVQTENAHIFTLD